MHFIEVAHFFEKISQNSSRTVITTLLSDLFKKASADEAMIICYLSLGLLRAPYRGTFFNFAEKSVAKVVAPMMNVSVVDVTQRARELGDLGTVVASASWKHDEDLSVIAVYQKMVELEDISGEGSQELKSHALTNLLMSVDALSAQYIVRMIMGRLRLGFSDMTLIDALSWMLVGNKSLHKDIEDAYNRCADIGLIAHILKTDGSAGLEHVSITVGIPVRPAAAERLPNAAAIIEKIGTCMAQPKIDGFRLQVHVDNRQEEQKIWFYSRNLQDMSPMFPDLVSSFKDLPVTTLIIEGEAIAYNEDTQSFVPFQETAKRKRKHGVEEAAAELPLKLFVFDILLVNDQETLSLGHAQRQEIIKNLFPLDHHATVSVIDEKVMHTAQELEDYFLAQLEEGLEGVVVKRLDAPYQPGKRNFNWIKLKRQEGSHLDDSIDTVILGYYKGRGKRSVFGIGAFLVGVYHKALDRFETIAKVGTGLKDADWVALKKRCDEHAVKAQPHNVVCAKELAPDVWVDPVVVCMVLADEITLSPNHSAGKTATHHGYALRFPRFIGYRPDKTAEQATDVAEIQNLFLAQKQR